MTAVPANSAHPKTRQAWRQWLAVHHESSPGLAKVAAAKADGSWSLLDGIEDLETPPDLEFALAALPHAAENFDKFPRSAKRGILEWIASAKRAETRQARVAETARLASRNERANQWTGKKVV